MSSLRDCLIRRERLVADGGMGTLLMERGLRQGDCPEALALSHPEWLVEIARSYREAGARLVQACTFGGSPLKLSAYGLEGRMEEVNRAAAYAAREGAGGGAWVYASFGPSGKILKPYGDTDPDAVLESYTLQAKAVAPLVDAVVVETMTDLREAVLAVKAVRLASPSTPVLATLTFNLTRRGIFTMMGDTIGNACRELEAAGADAVGSNCGFGSVGMLPVAEGFVRCTSLPVVVQPNAGLPEIVGTGVRYPESPGDMAESARRFLNMGVLVLGGCCGSTPEHIRAIRAELDAYLSDRDTV